jgi:hypothetical protein
MMKKVLTLLALLMAGRLGATECRSANFFLDFDVDDTNVIYGVVRGANSDPFGGGIRGPAHIKASNSTTVTSQTNGDNAFAEVAVGDSIFIRDSGTQLVTKLNVLARASADSITVDTAVTLADAAFTWLKTTTSATVGWLDISGYTGRTITVQYDQGDLGRLDVRIECRGSYPGAQPVQVFPACATGSCATYQAYTTVGIASRTSIVIPDPFGACRVGVKYAVSDASDATTNMEKFTAGFEGCLR